MERRRALVEPDDLEATEADRAADGGVLRQQAHQGQGDGRLPGPRFTDDGQRLTGVQVERRLVDRREPQAVDPEGRRRGRAPRGRAARCAAPRSGGSWSWWSRTDPLVRRGADAGCWHDGSVTEEVRPWYGRALTVAIALICAGMCIGIGLAGSWTDAALVAPWAALVALACWATFWRPMVAVSPTPVCGSSTSLRTIDIPWPAIQDVETKWALTLVTAYGRFTAWSAPAPGARERAALAGRRRPARRPPQRAVPSSPAGAGRGAR